MNPRELVERSKRLCTSWPPGVGDGQRGLPLGTQKPRRRDAASQERGLALAGGTGQLLFQPPGGKDHGAQRSGSRPLNGVLALRRGREEPKAVDPNQISHDQISHVHAEAIWCILAN
jgi:hypothetical protein